MDFTDPHFLERQRQLGLADWIKTREQFENALKEGFLKGKAYLDELRQSEPNLHPLVRKTLCKLHRRIHEKIYPPEIAGNFEQDPIFFDRAVEEIRSNLMEDANSSEKNSQLATEWLGVFHKRSPFRVGNYNLGNLVIHDFLEYHVSPKIGWADSFTMEESLPKALEKVKDWEVGQIGNTKELRNLIDNWIREGIEKIQNFSCELHEREQLRQQQLHRVEQDYQYRHEFDR